MMARKKKKRVPSHVLAMYHYIFSESPREDWTMTMSSNIHYIHHVLGSDFPVDGHISKGHISKIIKEADL